MQELFIVYLEDSHGWKTNDQNSFLRSVLKHAKGKKMRFPFVNKPEACGALVEREQPNHFVQHKKIW